MTVARKTIRGRLTTLTEAQVQAGARVTLAAVEVLGDGTTRTLDRVADLAGHLLMIGDDTHYVTREGDGSYSFSNVPVTDSTETSPTGFALEVKIVSGGELVESVVFLLPASDPDEQWIDEIVAMGDSPLTPTYPELVNEAVAALAAIPATITTTLTDNNSAATAVIVGRINSAINALVNGAPGALNTLKEIADQLATDEGAASSVAAALATHAGRTDNPHATTKAQVGLGSVDNTSDLAKPVSTAQAAAIATAISNLVAGAPGALDTLNELAVQLGSDENAAGALTTLVSGIRGLSDSTFLTGLNNAIAVPVAAARTELRRQAGAVPSRRVSLLAGTDDESADITTTSCSVTSDLTDFVLGDRSWLMTMSGAVTGQLKWTPATALDLPPVQAYGAAIYITDATKVTGIELDIYQDPAFATPTWIRTAAAANGGSYTLVNGWNFLRWTALAGEPTLTNLGHVTRIRVAVTTNAATTTKVGNVWAECAEKARMLFIADWGSVNFFGSPVGVAGSPYADLKARGIPVTLAWDPGNAGASLGGPTERLSVAAVVTLANDGNGNEISIHGYDGSITSSMTAAQIRADHLAAVKFIKRLGIPLANLGTAWRASWVQNLATNAAAAFPYMVASATPSANSAVGCWPPVNRFNIPRVTLHGAAGSGNVNQTAVNTMFTQLQTTRGFVAPYTHGVADNQANFMSAADWANFLAKLDAGIAAGWLECVTFNQLYAREGGRFRRTFGQEYAEFYDESGALTIQTLP